MAPAMKTNQEIMDDFFATRRYDKTPRDWRAVAETDPDTFEKVSASTMLKAISTDWHAHEAATSDMNSKKQPTEGQRHAGNYRKGHISIGGLAVAVENPAGSRRRPEWPPLKAHYGYAKRSVGVDGDGVDVFVKPATPLDYDGPVFVVDQVVGGKFDEHKALIGWQDEAAARRGYLENYEDGWDGLGAITRMEMTEFKDWLKRGDTTLPASRDFNRGE